MQQNSFDIIIVGNGILGLSTAYALTKKDSSLKICVIGPSQRIGGATTASGAMLNCFAELTTSSLSSKHGQAKFEMDVQALRMWESWLNQINDEQPEQGEIHIQQGTFVVLNSKSGWLDSHNYETIKKVLKGYQEP